VAVCIRLDDLLSDFCSQLRVIESVRDKRSPFREMAVFRPAQVLRLFRTCRYVCKAVTFLDLFDYQVLGRPGLESWLFAKPAYWFSLLTHVLWYDLLFCCVALNIWLSPRSCRIVYVTESSAMSGKV
jgi:hypothetical protein